jgi:uncharacterized protein
MTRPLTRIAASLASAGAVLAAYAFLIEPRWLQVRRTRLAFDNLPDGLEGLRIGLLTDLHVDRHTPLRLARRACRLLMRERPDLIAVTGDLISAGEPGFRPVIDVLRGLDAPLGVYVVPGNHDHAVGIEAWRQCVAGVPNLVDLTNRTHRLDVNGATLCIAGLDDFGEGRPRTEALPAAAEGCFTVLLAHNPKQTEQLPGAGADVDLVLSGHTHGGQVQIPGFGPVFNSAEHDGVYVEGVHERPQTTVYVSRGVGTVHTPVRLFSRPEVTVLELARRSSP